ncbi:hypothetical protein D3C71_1986490 [compost metagenome]
MQQGRLHARLRDQQRLERDDQRGPLGTGPARVLQQLSQPLGNARSDHGIEQALLRIDDRTGLVDLPQPEEVVAGGDGRHGMDW